MFSVSGFEFRALFFQEASSANARKCEKQTFIMLTMNRMVAEENKRY